MEQWDKTMTTIEKESSMSNSDKASQLQDIHNELQEIGEARWKYNNSIPNVFLNQHSNAGEGWLSFAFFITLWAGPIFLMFNYSSVWADLSILIPLLSTILLGVTSDERHTVPNYFALIFSKRTRAKVKEMKVKRGAFMEEKKIFEAITSVRRKQLFKEAKPFLTELNKIDLTYKYWVDEHGVQSKEADKTHARALKAFELN